MNSYKYATLFLFILFTAACESKLKEAQTRIDKIITGSDGNLDIVPANFDD